MQAVCCPIPITITDNQYPCDPRIARRCGIFSLGVSSQFNSSALSSFFYLFRCDKQCLADEATGEGSIYLLTEETTNDSVRQSPLKYLPCLRDIETTRTLRPLSHLSNTSLITVFQEASQL